MARSRPTTAELLDSPTAPRSRGSWGRGLRRRGAPGRADRLGAAAVEFAFSASIVFLLFMSMIEVARFHVVRHSLDQAVYMGCRTGIVPGATAAEAELVVADRLRAAGVINPTITVIPSVIDSATTDVTIRAVAPYEQNSWALPKFFSGVNVVAEITLDHENLVMN